MLKGVSAPAGASRRRRPRPRSRGWAEGGFDHPPSGSSGPRRHGAGTEGRRDLASRRRSDALSLAADLSNKTTIWRFWKSWRKCCVASPAGWPSRDNAREKKTRFAGEHLKVRLDPRRARLVATGGREVPPEGRTRSLRRWLRPPVLAAAAEPGTHGAGLKEVRSFPLLITPPRPRGRQRAGGERKRLE